jgi:hypothetical protein
MVPNQGDLTAKFYSLSRLSKWLTWTFLALVFAFLLSVISDFFQLRILSTIMAGGYASASEINRNDLWSAAISFIQTLIQLLTAVLFLVWVYRISKNLKRLNSYSTRFSSGWAVAYYFIPFLNLYRPYQVMAEVNEMSSSKYDPVNNVHPSNLFLGLWWAFFLVFDVFGNIAGKLLLRSETTEGLITSTWMYVGYELIGIAGAFITIYMIKRITNLQQNRNQQIAAEVMDMPQTVETTEAY